MFIFVLGKPQYDYGPRKQRMLRTHQDDKKPPRYTQMKPDQDWNSVWPAARTFHPAVVPLPVRQGATQLRNQVENNSRIMRQYFSLHWTLDLYLSFSFFSVGNPPKK